MVFRLQSSSTLILLATLSSPQEFVRSATLDTAFWSFYFGLAVIASGIALWLAIALRRRLLWDLPVLAKLSARRGPAWLPGVVIWQRPAAGSGLYDQLPVAGELRHRAVAA